MASRDDLILIVFLAVVVTGLYFLATNVLS